MLKVIQVVSEARVVSPKQREPGMATKYSLPSKNEVYSTDID